MRLKSRARIGRRTLAGLTAGTMVAVLGVALAPATPASAVTCTKTWNSGTSGTWNTAASWTPAGVPATTDDVCIQGTATYTVSITDTAAVAKSITVGGTAGNQTLALNGSCSANASLALTAASTISARGRLTLDTLSCGSFDAISLTAGKKLTNAGIITTGATNGGVRNLDVDLQQNTGAQLNINQSASFVSQHAITNSGAINIATGQTLDAVNGNVTNGAGGSINSTGTAKFTMRPVAGVFGTFTEGAGTTTGTPPQLEDTNIAYTGAGASTLTARGDGSGTVASSATLTGNIAASQVLNIFSDCSRNASRQIPASLTNAGTINLDTVSCGSYDQLGTATAGVVLTNAGTINVNATNGGTRNLILDVANTGTVNINQSAGSAGTAHAWINQGALHIADNQTFDWANGTFTNGAGGSITTSGGPSTGSFVMRPIGGVFGTFNEGAGTTSGRPLQLEDVNINYTGSGASTIAARGDGAATVATAATLTGNIAASQTLDIFSDCSRNASRRATASFTNAGTINLDTLQCGSGDSLYTTNATPVLTNTGTINVGATNGGLRNLNISITNTGAINVHLNADAVNARTFNQNGGTIKIDNGKSLNWRSGAFNNNAGTIGAVGFGGRITGSGLWTQNNGTIVGATVGRAGSIVYTGTGPGRIDASGTSGTLTGTMVAGQSLNLLASCATNTARNLPANFTNGGVITLKTTACGSFESITSSNPAVVLTNTGTITTDATNGGGRNLATSITNNGTININQNSDAVGTYTFVNNKTINIADTRTFNWRGGTFTNATNGVINATGSGNLRLETGSTYHAQNGTTTGTNPVISDNGNLVFDATGAVGASTVVAFGTGGTVSGLIRPNQALQLSANCGENASRATTGAFTNNGTLTMITTSCGSFVKLDATTGGFINGGNVVVDDTNGGARTVVGNFTNNKTLTVGATTLTVSGNFTSNNAASNIATRVANAGAFAHVNASGAVALGGKLTVNTDAGFWPSAGQDYGIINGASRTGTFATTTGLTRTGQTVSYHVQYTSTGVNLHVS